MNNVPTVETICYVTASKEIHNVQEMWKRDMGPHTYIRIYCNHIVKNTLYLTLFMDWEDLTLEMICSMRSASPEVSMGGEDNNVQYPHSEELVHSTIHPYIHSDNVLLASQCFSSYLTSELVATSATSEHHVN